MSTWVLKEGKFSVVSPLLEDDHGERLDMVPYVSPPLSDDDGETTENLPSSCTWVDIDSPYEEVTNFQDSNLVVYVAPSDSSCVNELNVEMNVGSCYHDITVDKETVYVLIVLKVITFRLSLMLGIYMLVK